MIDCDWLSKKQLQAICQLANIDQDLTALMNAERTTIPFDKNDSTIMTTPTKRKSDERYLHFGWLSRLHELEHVMWWSNFGFFTVSKVLVKGKY